MTDSICAGRVLQDEEEAVKDMLKGVWASLEQRDRNGGKVRWR